MSAPDIDEVRARHPGREIRRDGFTWVAADLAGNEPPVESASLDRLDAALTEAERDAGGRR